MRCSPRCADRSTPLVEPEQILDMMSELVRDHVRLGEISGSAQTAREIVEEAEIEVDLAVFWAVERPRRRLRKAARRLDRVAEQDHLRAPVTGAELLRPHVLGVLRHHGHFVDEPLLGRRGRNLAARPHRLRRRGRIGPEQREEIGAADPAQHEQHEEAAYP
jgi:hypothetical protein